MKNKMDRQANAKIWGGQKTTSCSGRDSVLARIELERATLADIGLCIEIRWPSGIVQRIDRPAVDRIVKVDEPEQASRQSHG